MENVIYVANQDEFNSLVEQLKQDIEATTTEQELEACAERWYNLKQTALNIPELGTDVLMLAGKIKAKTEKLRNLIPEAEVKKILDNLNAVQVIKDTYKELTPMAGAFCTTYLNCETGEVFQFSGTQGTTIDESHLVMLYNLTFQEVFCIPVIDILGDDPMPETEDITDLEDYDQRVVEALCHYADNQLDGESIMYKIGIIYNA